MVDAALPIAEWGRWCPRTGFGGLRR